MPIKELHQYVIYDKPKDYPTKFVVRQWIIMPGTATPGPLLKLADTIEEARQAIPENSIQLATYPTDDPVIAEVWI